VLKGKLAYLSPEQVRGVSLDARSDIFAVGLVLYELLAGKKLFTQPDPAEVLDSIVHINPDEVARSLPGIARPLRDVLRRALAVDPESRFRSAGEMQIALEEYLRASGDPGGTMQLTNLMRLLFDEKVGEHTSQILRSQLLGRPPRASRSTVRSGSSKRLVAALGGAALGVVALLVASPKLRAWSPQPPSPSKDAAPQPPSTASRVEPPEAPIPPPREEPPVDSAAPPEVAKPPAPDGLADARRATEALAANHPGEAIAAFDKAFATSPDLRAQYGAPYAKALTEEGKSLFETDSDAAARRFQEAIAADPDSFDAHFFLAKVYTRKSDPEAALKEYGEAIRINPKSADAQFNLGFVYFSQKRYEDAQRQYEKVIELSPPYLADVFYNLSACYEQMKRKDDAIATLRRGLAAVPKSDLLRQRLKQLGG
jgi:tetratricopeptide (TPR) repeat protein